MIKFVDLCNAFNVHAFIVWEFIRRYEYTKGVKKDKWGRGSVQSSECNKWLHEFSEYLVFQEYSYKQEINKGQYTYISEERRQREVESEQDLERVYGVDEDGSIVRGTVFASGGRQVWKWNDLFQSWQLVSD